MSKVKRRKGGFVRCSACHGSGRSCKCGNYEGVPMNGKVPWDFSYDKNDANMVPNLPSEQGRLLGAELSRLTEVNRAEHDRLFPNAPGQCADCAFKAGTEPNGCVPTVMDAIKSVLEDEPFYCHHGVVDDKPKRLCSGWSIATMLTESDLALQTLQAKGME